MFQCHLSYTRTKQVRTPTVMTQAAVAKRSNPQDQTSKSNSLDEASGCIKEIQPPRTKQVRRAAVMKQAVGYLPSRLNTLLNFKEHQAFLSQYRLSKYCPLPL